MTSAQAQARTVAATATRRGVRPFNCDAAAVFTSADGATAAAVVDGIGNSEAVAAMSAVLAQVIARTAGRRGCLAALLTAGETIGDSRIYGFDGHRVRQYSIDATVGEQLRLNGAPLEIAADHDNWLKISLSRATIGTVYTAYVPEDELVLLCSDGVPDHLPAGRLQERVEQHADDPQALADALVNETTEDGDGYRDDATVIVLQLPA